MCCPLRRSLRRERRATVAGAALATVFYPLMCEGPKMGSAATQIPSTTNGFLQLCAFGGSQTITMPSTP